MGPPTPTSDEDPKSVNLLPTQLVREERVVARGQKDRDVVRVLIHRGDIEPAVGVEIRRGDAEGSKAHQEVPGGLERAVPQAQQNRNVARPGIRRRDIQTAVAVEIAGDMVGRRHGKRIVAVKIHPQRLRGWRGRIELSDQREIAGAAQEPLDLDEVRPGQQVLHDEIVRRFGRLAVAGHQQFAIRIQQARAGRQRAVRLGPGLDRQAARLSERNREQRRLGVRGQPLHEHTGRSDRQGRGQVAVAAQ